MVELILKLVLAHIVGDFLLQPNNWVVDKEKNTYKSKYLYYHILIHFASIVILLQFDFTYWFAILIIIPSHYVIDLVKTLMSKRINKRLLFGLDQILHFLILGLVVNYYYPLTSLIEIFWTTKTMLFVIFVLLNTVVVSIIMRVIFSKWNINNEFNKGSLEMAGTYIGMLERLLVFAFIITNHWSSIGFLMAAKSIFRFGDLSRAQDRKLTEYVLIGTLISFGLAIVLGLSYQYFLSILPQH